MTGGACTVCDGRNALCGSCMRLAGRLLHRRPDLPEEAHTDELAAVARVLTITEEWSVLELAGANPLGAVLHILRSFRDDPAATLRILTMLELLL